MDYQAYGVYLCSVNTSGFYEKQMDLARTKAALYYWKRHVMHHAIPEYRRSEDDYRFGLTAEQIEQVALELQDYYNERVKEENQE